MSGEDYTDVFLSESAKISAPDSLMLPAWRERDWRKLLDSTTVKPYRASEVVIQRGTIDRALTWLLQVFSRLA